MTQPFDVLKGVAVPLPLTNIDTDQIIPKQFLKTIERHGLGKGAFYDFRFDREGQVRPDFVLNQPAYAGANMLFTGDNFGCGSSREHAPWALLDLGIRCVASTSFADIFYNNCCQNGLLPAVVSEQGLSALLSEALGGGYEFVVNLKSQTITAPSGAVVAFHIAANRKDGLLHGLDCIADTMRYAAEIDAFESKLRSTKPWILRL
jgi:3-isopropylmalate dehydratase/3-isopropylmalate/(R)-2-methylmalate dehydratase small subunit